MRSARSSVEYAVFVGLLAIGGLVPVDASARDAPVRAALSSVQTDELRFRSLGPGEEMVIDRRQGFMGIMSATSLEIRGPLPDLQWRERLEFIGIGRAALTAPGRPADQRT